MRTACGRRVRLFSGPRRQRRKTGTVVVGHHPATAPRSAPPRQPKCRFSPLAAGPHGARPAAARPEREARSWPLRSPLLALAAAAGAAGLAGEPTKGTQPLDGAAGAQAAARPRPWPTTAASAALSLDLDLSHCEFIGRAPLRTVKSKRSDGWRLPMAHWSWGSRRQQPRSPNTSICAS